MRAVVLAFLSVCGRLVEGAILLRAPGPTLALCEAIAFAVQFKNVDVMGQAIEQSTGQPLGADAFMMPPSWNAWCVARGREVD